MKILNKLVDIFCFIVIFIFESILGTVKTGFVLIILAILLNMATGLETDFNIILIISLVMGVILGFTEAYGDDKI